MRSAGGPAFLLASLAWASGTMVLGQSAESPSRLVVERLRLTGGALPVAGVEDGAVFPLAGEPCSPASDCVTAPIATVRSSAGDETPMALEIQLADASAVDCVWRLEPDPAPDASCPAFTAEPLSGTGSWEGRRGEVTVARPATTGAYRLSLACGAGGEPARFASRLFVTYGEPLAVASPPEPAWLERATCWASGLGDGDGEDRVLARVLEGLFVYGGEHWRYGYARKTGPGTYAFPLGDGESQTYRVPSEGATICSPAKDGETCKCRWQSLVASGSKCAFADCYVFSDVLQAMSAVMGVGGLRYSAIRGRARAGFLTSPSPSLDPEFVGTGCLSPGETCFQFMFSSHSLRQRDGLFYDATFAQTQEIADTSIELSRAPSCAGRATFLDSDLELDPAGKGYGNWMAYHAPDAVPQTVEREHLRFRGDVDFTPINSDRDERYEALRADFDVELLIGGTYILNGDLSRNGRMVARQPDWWSTEQTLAIVSGDAGSLHRVTLMFSGQQIVESGVDGPWDFAAAADEGGQKIEAKTPALPHHKFGELDAAIEHGVRARRTGRDGDAYRTLTLSVPFMVWQPAVYTLEARLSKSVDGRVVTIAYAGERRFFDRSWWRREVPVTFKIPGHKIATAGLDAPWQLTLVLYDAHRKAMSSALVEVEENWPASSFR